MIRVCIFNTYAYGYDITSWEKKPSEFYDNLLDEDLIERVSQRDIIMYFDTNENAKEWCTENELEYELVENDDN